MPNEFTASEFCEKSADGVYSAGIDIDRWSHQIQCHGDTEQEAIYLRDYVLEAILNTDKDYKVCMTLPDGSKYFPNITSVSEDDKNNVVLHVDLKYILSK